MAELDEGLTAELTRAGYYPQLVSSVLDIALADEPVVSYLVQLQTGFDEEIRRHLTVLVLTSTRLIAAHVDDHEADDNHPSSAAATTEAVGLSEIRSVALTHLIAEPAKFGGADADMGDTEVNLAISWGGMARVELEPMLCPNPDCEGDHGVIGQLVPDDVLIRVSSAAEGPAATAAAIDFARKLSAATSQRA